MEFKSYSDILELHTQFASSFEKRLAALKKELPKTPDGLLSTKRTALKHAQEAMKAAEKTRDNLIKRANVQVAQRKDDAARLSREIDDLEGEIRKAAKAGSTHPASKTRARPAKPK